MKSAKSIGRIHIAKIALELDDESFEAILLQHSINSSVDMSETQAATLIADFERMGWIEIKPGYKARHWSMATATQVRHIEILWKVNSGSKGSTALNRWLDLHFDVSALPFVTSKKASQIIEALRLLIHQR